VPDTHSCSFGVPINRSENYVPIRPLSETFGNILFGGCVYLPLGVVDAPTRAVPKALAASIDTSTAVGRHDGELTRSAAYAIQAHSLDLLEPPGIRSALARASANGT
jgi:hypothetical protein